jgi:hypothetical protein
MRVWVCGLITAAMLLLMPALFQAQTSSGTAGSVAGRIVRPDGLPQPEAQVVLAQRTAAGTLRQLQWRARSAFDGRYEISGVPPGRYLVLVRAIGADVARAGRPDATLFPGVPLSENGVPVDVVAGLSTEGIDVWLVPSPRRFTLSGRVFGPGGATAFDSLVIEMGRAGERATDVWNSTEGGGLFTIDPAPPGTLVLRAHATLGDRVLTGLAATTVASSPVEDIRIIVRPPVAVAGRVRPVAGVALPAGLFVALVPQAIEPSVLYPPVAAPVDAEGRFTVQGDAAPLRIVVSGLPEAGARRVAAGARC